MIAYETDAVGCRGMALGVNSFHWDHDVCLAYLQLLYFSEFSAVAAVIQAYNYNIFEKTHPRNK